MQKWLELNNAETSDIGMAKKGNMIEGGIWENAAGQIKNNHVRNQIQNAEVSGGDFVN